MKNMTCKKINAGVIVALVFFTLASKPVSASPILIHQGSNDPTTEGWALSNIGSAGTLVGGTEVTASGSHEYWQVEDADTSGGGFLRYSATLSPIDLSGDWFFEASVRVINGSPVPGTNIPPQSLIVADGLNYWSFYLGDNVVGALSSSSALIPSLSTSIDFSDYHTFGIQFSHNGAGTADDTADFFIDGGLVYNDVGRSQVFASSNNFTHFGTVSSPAVGGARYESVVFDNGVISSVPAPAAVWLIGFGIIALIGVRKKSPKLLEKHT